MALVTPREETVTVFSHVTSSVTPMLLLIVAEHCVKNYNSV